MTDDVSNVDPPKNPKHGMLSLSIKDKKVLYNAYMPFLKEGGLFIPTEKQYQLGDEVFILLALLDEPEKIAVSGKVVWITPKGAQGNKAPGIGIQFHDEDNVVRSKIETLLAGMLQAETPTHTM